MSRILQKIQKSINKNKLEAIALVTGKMPSFIYGKKNFKDIPVFCFHSAQYPLFENQLQFLCMNGYKTLTADELYERRSDKYYRNNGKEIALTFDDGMASVWTTAYPLLQKYEKKIISFILPGLMTEGGGVGLTIDDVKSEEEKIYLSNRDYSDKPLCSWQEVIKMHESGLVDFQSHGMNHALISTSNKIVDFIHPGFDAYHYGNIHIPMYRDAEGHDSRKKVLGHPVYEHAPRLVDKKRYLDPVGLRDACARFVAEQGGENFFVQHNWRNRLEQIICDYKINYSDKYNDYESSECMRLAQENELSASKRIIEDKLNKCVNHFCFPWFAASIQSAALAKECGYQDIHLGEVQGFRMPNKNKIPVTVSRVQEEYIYCLPGIGRRTLYSIWGSKIYRGALRG